MWPTPSQPGVGHWMSSLPSLLRDGRVGNAETYLESKAKVSYDIGRLVFIFYPADPVPLRADERLKLVGSPVDEKALFG